MFSIKNCNKNLPSHQFNFEWSYQVVEVWSCCSFLVTHCISLALLFLSFPPYPRKRGESFDKDNVVPKCYEGKSQEKAQRSSKLSHQSRQRIDQELCLDRCLSWTRPKRKCEMFRLENWLDELSFETISFVLAGFQAVGEFLDLFVFSNWQLVIYSFIFPGK